MIRVDNNYSLSLLFADVHHVLSEASKEFHDIEYRFEYDSKRKGVKSVRFIFIHRKSYYSNVYPDIVALFCHLDMLKQCFFSSFTFVRHSVDSYIENGVKKYSLVLWY